MRAVAPTPCLTDSRGANGRIPPSAAHRGRKALREGEASSLGSPALEQALRDREDMQRQLAEAREQASQHAARVEELQLQLQELTATPSISPQQRQPLAEEGEPLSLAAAATAFGTEESARGVKSPSLGIPSPTSEAHSSVPTPPVPPILSMVQEETKLVSVSLTAGASGNVRLELVPRTNRPLAFSTFGLELLLAGQDEPVAGQGADGTDDEDIPEI